MWPGRYDIDTGHFTFIPFSTQIVDINGLVDGRAARNTSVS